MIVKKLWGYESILVNLPQYCSKILTVLPNDYYSSLHFHKLKQETFTILRGALFLEVYAPLEELAHLVAFDSELIKSLKLVSRAIYRPCHKEITIKPLQAHRFWSAEPQIAEFLETSTFDDPKDSYRIVPSGCY